MKTFVALALAGYAAAQGVTSAIAPEASAPSGCETSADGEFQVSVVNVTTSAKKRGVERRQLSGTLTVTLSDGVMVDQADRTAYIAANYQWQFDDPPQTGAIYTSGFSLCSNNSFALGGSAVFYQCYTGGFYNIYDRDWADQCTPIYLVAVSSGTVSQTSDGQPAATTAITQVTQQTDGQPGAPTSGVVVTQSVISQISDGQPQAPTSGQVVSQISDGQVQAPTSAAVISQISDGQPQAPTTAGPIITQISDGQPQSPTSFISQNGTTGNYSATASAPAEFTGAAATPAYGVGAFAAGLFGLAALL